MKWFFPSWNGDHRLRPILEGDTPYRSRPNACALEVSAPTAVERNRINEFLEVAKEKGWTSTGRLRLRGNEAVIHLDTGLATAGRKLEKILRPSASRITAIRYSDGRVVVERAGEAQPVEEAEAAVTTMRGFRGCPAPVPVNFRASEALAAFLDPAQTADWEKRKALVVYGSDTQAPYVVFHRGHPSAMKNEYIGFCLASGGLLGGSLCYHDWSVPPEEEVLGLKLLIEHDESWLWGSFGGPIRGIRAIRRNPRRA